MRRSAGLLAPWLAAVVALGGCKKDEPEEARAGTEGTTRGAVKVVDHVGLFAHVPEGALAVLTFDASVFWEAALEENFGMVPIKEDPAAVREAVARASRQTLGVDVTAVREVVVWGTFSPQEGPAVAVLLRGDFSGDLPGTKAGAHEGADLVQLPWGAHAAKVEGGLVLGNESGVKTAAALAAGKGVSLAEAGAGSHATVLKPIGPGMMTATVALGSLAPLVPPPLKGLTGAALSFGGGDGRVELAITGEAATLDALTEQYEAGLKMARAQLEEVVRELREEGNPALIPLVYVEQKWEDFTAPSRPTREGDVLLTGVSFDSAGSGGVLLATTGILAAVAIPAFIKYMRRAKTTEAIDQLDRMYRGAAVYFTTPRVAGGTGAKLPCQFPPSAELTPKPVGGVHPCCAALDADGDDRCDPSAERWNGETWAALDFQVNEPHYFMYEFESNGETGAGAKFTARAHADLDCDGVFSTFERYGYGDESGECTMTGSSAFYKHLETE